MSQPSETQLLLDQMDALMEQEDAEALFFTPSRVDASSPSTASRNPLEPRAPIATPRRKTPQNRTPTPLTTGSADPGSSAGISSRSLVQRTLTPPASASTTKPTYPTKWTKGHDEALVIFAASLSLLHRQYLQKLPFFEPWSGYGWSHLSAHLRKAMRNSLRAQGSSFELPNLSKGLNGGGSLPGEVVQAMGQAIMRGAEGATSPTSNKSLPFTPRRRFTADMTSRSPLAKKSSGKRRLQAGTLPPLASEEEDAGDLESSASSAELRTPPPRAKRPKRSAAGKRSAAPSALKGLTSSGDEEEDSLCLGAKKRRRRRSPSTDSALDELWVPQTPTVDRTSRSTRRSAQTPVKRPTRPSARPLVQAPASPPAPIEDVDRPAASQQLVRAEAMCIDLTLSEDD